MAPLHLRPCLSLYINRHVESFSRFRRSAGGLDCQKCCFFSPRLQPCPSWSCVQCLDTHRPCSSLRFCRPSQTVRPPTYLRYRAGLCWVILHMLQINSQSENRHNNTLPTFLPHSCKIRISKFPCEFCLNLSHYQLGHDLFQCIVWPAGLKCCHVSLNELIKSPVLTKCISLSLLFLSFLFPSLSCTVFFPSSFSVG